MKFLMLTGTYVLVAHCDPSVRLWIWHVWLPGGLNQSSELIAQLSTAFRALFMHIPAASLRLVCDGVQLCSFAKQ